MRRVKAILQVNTGAAGIREFPVHRVSNYTIETSLDNDADPFSIDIPDLSRDYAFLQDRNVEVVVNLFSGEDVANVERLHYGFSDTVGYDSEDSTLSISGRDMSSLATDTAAPPFEQEHVFPNVLIRDRARELGFTKIRMPALSSVRTVYTDGSESEWELWYRLMRQKDMWIYTEPDGTLVGGTLGYDLKPKYFFGHRDPKYYGNWHKVEHVQFHKNNQQRLHQVWMYGERGDRALSPQASVDESLSSWLKQPIKIELNAQAQNEAELKKMADDEMFDSIVGAIEFTLRIRDKGQLIRQNNMGYVNLPERGIKGLYFIVGVRLLGGETGYFQEVRFREKGFALPRRVPDAPVPPEEDRDDSEDEDVVVQSAADILTKEGIKWANCFLNGAKKWHNGDKGSGGGWDLATFLGVVLSICKVETDFTNIRTVVLDGKEVRGSQWYPYPTPSNTARIEQWKKDFANKAGNPLNPNPSREAAVGPMQLKTNHYKELADKHFSSDSISETEINVTVAEIKKAIAGFPMEDNAQDFYDAGVQYGVHPGFMVGLAAAESTLGTNNFHPFNPFGYHQDSFDSFHDAIFYVTSAIAGKPPTSNPHYFAAGRFGAIDIYTGGGSSAYCQSGCEDGEVTILKFVNLLHADPDNVKLGKATKKVKVGAIDEYQGGRWVPCSNIVVGCQVLWEKSQSPRPGEPTLDPTKTSQIWEAVKRYRGTGSDGDETRYANEVKKWFDSTYGPLAQQAIEGAVHVDPVPTGSGFTLGKLKFPEMPSSLETVIRAAYKQLGKPYEYGANGPDTFDCSGLMQFAYAKANIDITRTTHTQIKQGTAVTRDNLKPGDIVFFDDTGHNGMYLTDNIFIHSPHTGDVVKLSGLGSSWYDSKYEAARRYVDWDQVPVGPPSPSGKIKKVYIQGGHIPPGQPGFGDDGETTETKITRAIRDELVRRLESNANFNVTSLPGQVPDTMVGDLFFSIHGDASESPLATGTSFGYPSATATESRKLKAFIMRGYASIDGPANSHDDNYTGGLAGYYAYSHFEGGCALLHEVGFYSNTVEHLWILSHLDQIAEVHYKAICSYFGVPA